jgi:high-affinity iron transporter
MRNKVQFFKTWFLAVAACFMIAATAMAQPTDRVDAKQLWQLIDYVAVDYSGAVADDHVSY